MTQFVNYDQLLADAAALVTAANLGFKQVRVDANDRDYVYDNMPLLDLRMKRAVPVATGGQEYYVEVLMEAEITAFDVTSLREASKIRNDLLGNLQRVFKQNPHFSAETDTVLIGNAQFGTGEDRKTGALIAAVVTEFLVKLYSGP